ncbi:hypothetical protein ACI2LC_28865 [Nonomuraea wenchangensis]|uniref:hypothetical protein n=1 Tax=Nonomuraea wenchangensis TaxID=568860 RepID=UPI0033F75408
MKLRVEDLEADRDMSGGQAAARQAELLREINERTRHLQKEIAALRGRIGEVCLEMGQDLAALQTEVEGVRRAMGPSFARVTRGCGGDAELRAGLAEGFAGVRAEMAQEFESVRSEMVDLGIKLDRLLAREDD